jgi:hypothetical protein
LCGNRNWLRARFRDRSMGGFCVSQRLSQLFVVIAFSRWVAQAQLGQEHLLPQPIPGDLIWSGIDGVMSSQRGIGMRANAGEIALEIGNPQQLVLRRWSAWVGDAQPCGIGIERFGHIA